MKDRDHIITGSISKVGTLEIDENGIPVLTGWIISPGYGKWTLKDVKRLVKLNKIKQLQLLTDYRKESRAFKKAFRKDMKRLGGVSI